MSAVATECADAVIIGGGIAGALTAKRLVEAGMKVVVLEAGADAAADPDAQWEAYLQHYHANPIKTPNSPYPVNPAAPSPEVLDAGGPQSVGYFLQRGPHPFGSNYTRVLGGTTLHWLGIALRLTPACFELKTRYGRGVDWPIGYTHLERWYSEAEWALGVSAEVEDQSFHGIAFQPDYAYPMRRIPASYLDDWLAPILNDKTYRAPLSEGGHDEISLQVRNIASARNGIPRPGPTVVNDVERAEYLAFGGSPGLAWRGQRCEGNSSCIPICPVQAKYSALKTFWQARQAHPERLEIRTQAVATKLEYDAEGRVTGVLYKRYDAPGAPSFTERRIAGRIVVMAATAIENAKLGLASGLRDESDQLGRNLMDHPFLLRWGLAPKPIGAFRGPGVTSGIENFRDGAFRKDYAGFRTDIGNWGWNFATGAPESDVVSLAREGWGPEDLDTAHAGKPLRGADFRRAIARRVRRQVRLGAVTEQIPLPENRVTISPDATDALGEPRPILDYRIDDYTYAGLKLADSVYQAVFAHAGIADRSVVHRDRNNYLTSGADDPGLNYYGSGHNVGTHRMGASAREGVTDPNSRAFGHPNLWIVGAGSMPTIGTCNPTLTLAALTLMAAENMVETIRSLP
jgi:choline dehydrogenase-like flavoprotein